MARHWFLGDMAAWAMALGADETSVDSQSGKRALIIPAASITFWTAQTGGTQITDLLDSIGTPITSVTADSGDGEFPPVQGPDTDPDTGAETWEMWADGSGGAGPRRRVVATDIGDVLSATIDSLTDLIAQVGGLQTLISNSPGAVEYDTETSSWPTRPDGDSRWYLWVGPTAPPVGTPYMQDGRDVWINTAPAA